MSTTLTQNKVTFHAANAVDNVKLPNGNPETRSIASSKNQKQPWWRVDLGQMKCVYGIDVLNRACPDCNNGL